MKYELSQEFYFDAAHTLERTIETDASKRIHGHTYHAKITITGIPDPLTGMVVDLGTLKKAVFEVRNCLDHRFLDEIAELKPATLENLCAFIWRKFEEFFVSPEQILVERKASGDSCLLKRG